MKPRLRADTWDIRIARPSEWSQALQCWFGPEAGSDQLHAQYFQLEHDPELAQGLWIAGNHDQIDAVVWVLPARERFAHCWPLRCRAALPLEQQEQVSYELWQFVAAKYQSEGVQFFQVNIPAKLMTDYQRMVTLGFQQMAVIQCLRQVIRHNIRAIAQPIKLVPAQPNSELSFTNVMIESMQESLDVPELNHLQSVDEVAAQYDRPGIERFFIFHQTRSIVGVIALEHDCETGRIRYLGLPPSVRGHGWGLLAVQEAVRWLTEQGCQTVELRADSRNLPALNIYHWAGFQLDSQEIMLVAR